MILPNHGFLHHTITDKNRAKERIKNGQK